MNFKRDILVPKFAFQIPKWCRYSEVPGDWSALHMAVEAHSLGAAESLLNGGADKESRIYGGAVQVWGGAGGARQLAALDRLFHSLRASCFNPCT